MGYRGDDVFSRVVVVMVGVRFNFGRCVQDGWMARSRFDGGFYIISL